MTPEETAIKAGIEARLMTLRQEVARHQREAASHQHLSQQHAMETIRLTGGIAELETLLSGFDQTPAAG